MPVCARCKSKALMVNKLGDSTVLCHKCFAEIPSYMQDQAQGEWTRAKYQKFVEQKGINALYGYHFTETLDTLRLDCKDGALMISRAHDGVIYRLAAITELEFSISNVTIQKRFIKTMVYGNISVNIRLCDPAFYFSVVVASNAKLDYTIENGTYVYNLPRTYKIFLGRLNMARNKQIQLLEAKKPHVNPVHKEKCVHCEHTEQAPPPPEQKTPHQKEIEKALCLFMIDDETVLTADILRKQRNMLLKAFHPDEGAESNEQYAKKINAAYSVLSEYLKERNV